MGSLRSFSEALVNWIKGEEPEMDGWIESERGVWTKGYLPDVIGEIKPEPRGGVPYHGGSLQVAGKPMPVCCPIRLTDAMKMVDEAFERAAVAFRPEAPRD